MERYCDAFLRHCIDGQSLFEIQSEDLRRLGIRSADEQRIFKNHIATLLANLRSEVMSWSVEDVLAWMSDNGAGKFNTFVQKHSIDGKLMVQLKRHDSMFVHLTEVDQVEFMGLRDDLLCDNPSQCLLQNPPKKSQLPYREKKNTQEKEYSPFHLLLPVSSKSLTDTSTITADSKSSNPPQGGKVSVIKVKTIAGDTFTEKVISPNETFESFQNWICENFGPDYVAKCLSEMGFISIRGDREVRFLYLSGLSKDVKVFLYERPYMGAMNEKYCPGNDDDG
jgi:hypothetical protein